jgi:hypothetical protein
MFEGVAMNKKIINIKIDNARDFSFTWNEEGSWHTNTGCVVKEEDQDSRQRVVDLDCSRVWVDKDGKKHYTRQCSPNNPIQKAMDWVFRTYSDVIYCGLEFKVVVYLAGKPEVIGMPTSAADNSWMVQFKKKDRTETKANYDDDAESEADRLLNL